MDDPYTSPLRYTEDAEQDVLGKYLVASGDNITAFGPLVDAVWNSHRLYPYMTQLERPGLVVLSQFLAWANKMGLYTPGEPSEFLSKQIWVPVGAVGPLLVLGHHDYRVPFDGGNVVNEWCSGRCLITKAYYDTTLAALRDIAERGFMEGWIDPADGTDTPATFEASPNFEGPIDAFRWMASHCMLRENEAQIAHVVLNSPPGASVSWPPGWDAAVHFLRTGHRLIDVSTCSIPKYCAEIVPPSLVAEYHAVCVFATPTTLFCAIPDPDSQVFKDHLLGLLTDGSNRQVVLLLADRAAVDFVVSGGTGLDSLDIHSSSGAVREQRVNFTFNSSELEGFDPRAIGNSTEPYCKWLLMRAVKLRASDIHFEQLSSGDGRVRFRIGGNCRTIDQQPGEFIRSVVQVLRGTWAGMQGNDPTEPTGGRFTFKLDSFIFDVRLESIGASQWDFPALSMRILGGGFRDINSIGFSQKDIALFNVLIRRPNGLIIIGGATGSGKSTTLTAALTAVNQPDLRLLTVEDPVEYRVDGTVQVDVDEYRGRTFSKVIKSYMRQDPDVILLGEIRDLDAATEAAAASLTGHLVFASLHVSSASEVPLRLVELGLKRHVVADTLAGMSFQVLIPKLCPNCKNSVPLLENEIRSFKRVKCEKLLKKGARVFAHNPKGCRTCSGGYQGRLLASELFPVHGVFKEMIRDGASRQQLAAAYELAGHVPYYNHLLALVARGEVAMSDVVPYDPYWWDVDGTHLTASADALAKLGLNESDLHDELVRRRATTIAKVPDDVIEAEIARLRDERLKGEAKPGERRVA